MEKAELLKLTVPKLREEALKIGATGVHGLKKAELTAVLAEHYGIELEEKHEKEKPSGTFKQQIKKLREEKVAALKAKDANQARILRRKIHRLKRLTRK